MQTSNRETRWYAFHSMALLTLALVLSTGMAASAQSTPPRGDNDTKGWQVADMDKFLDSHPEIAEQLQKDPSLIRNDEFVDKHPELQEYLRQHPGIREEFTENPRAFMRQEQRLDRHEDAVGDNRDRDRDINREELANTDRFMDSHPEIAEQLRKDPTLIKNREFVEKHPALQEFLQTHPGVREEFSENPNAFMHRENRFDAREDDRDRRIGDRDDRSPMGERDVTRGELASADRFMDSHPEIAEQLRKDPTLINNKEFVEKHPALQEFLKTHPETGEELREHPNAFMRQEQRFDEREESRNREASPGDRDRQNSTSFGQFLGGHASLAQQLSRDPSLANNKEFLASHAELRDYLKAHPEVRNELATNPQGVMASTPRPDATPTPNPTPSPKIVPAPGPTPKVPPTPKLDPSPEPPQQ